MTEENTESIDLTFNTDVGVIKFKTFEELHVWARNEHDMLGWVGTYTDQDLKEQKTSYAQFHSVIVNHSDRTRNSHQDDNSALETIQTKFLQFFNTAKGVTSESPLGQFIIQQREKYGDISAAWSLYTLVGPSTHRSPTTLDAIKGVFRALDYTRGSSDSLESLESSLELMKARWETTFEEKRGKFDESLSVANSVFKEWTEAVETQRTQIIKAEASRTRAFDEFLKKSNQEMVDLTQLYKAGLTLRAPVDYWEKKAGKHTTTMIQFGKAAMWLAGLFVALVVVLSFFAGKSPATANVGQIIIIVSVSTIMIWTIRLAAKIAIANMHLRDDALERVTMMNAYLALSSDSESGLSPTDMELVLGALFRPASSGLINDDGVNSPIEVINKIIRRE